ncbi:conserved hypothetical protein [Planctopirus limnophila DSM 3776]|uniref:Uncharacterized protein n=2 Tax=Planctopirus limnophila TaxID=120 RepID=D5SWK0_PLAL2|nr:conserved hypothetical protein [Planctopirus limnophila DSM 3776]
MKSQLTNAGNTIVPAYLALLARGLSIVKEPSAFTESGMIWVAEDTTTQFSAEDLVTLLGLVAMQETRGAGWQASDEEIESFFAKYGVP